MNKNGDTIVYYITAIDTHERINYLAWQNPAWDESGYYWTTSLEAFRACLPNNTTDHPFVFDNMDDATKFVAELGLPFGCKIMEWNIHNRTLPKENGGRNKLCYPGIAIELTK